AAQRVTRWPERGLARTAALMESGGTGGALFRNLYRDFLAECTTLVDSDALRTGHRLYGEAAELWTRVAACIATADLAGASAPRRPDHQPFGSSGSPPAAICPGVSWLLVMASTAAADRIRRPWCVPWSRSIRAKARKSSAVESRPPAPDGKAGGTVHSSGFD